MDINLKTFCHREPNKIIYDLLEIVDISILPTTPGAYILVSKNQKFIYPNGKSRVIYIGKAENLRNRLRTHKRVITKLSKINQSERNTYWWYSRHQYLVKFGCKVYYFTRKGKQEAKNLENLLLEEFYDRYYSLPVGNGAISFRKIKM